MKIEVDSKDLYMLLRSTMRYALLSGQIHEIDFIADQIKQNYKIFSTMELRGITREIKEAECLMNEYSSVIWYSLRDFLIDKINDAIVAVK